MKRNLFKRPLSKAIVTGVLSLAITPLWSIQATEGHEFGTRESNELSINHSCRGPLNVPDSHDCATTLLKLIKNPSHALDLRVKALIRLGVQCRHGMIAMDECLQAYHEIADSTGGQKSAFPFQKVFGNLTQNRYSHAEPLAPSGYSTITSVNKVRLRQKK